MDLHLPLLVAQQVAVQAPDLGTNLTAAFISVRVLEYLKAQGWFSWVGPAKANANRIAAALIALVAAIGVNYTITAGPAPGDYIITVTGLTASAIGAAAWAWTKQFIAQELIYRTTVQQALPAGDK